MMTVITLGRFLAALYADAARSSLIEVRYRHGQGMRQAFIGADRLADVAAAIRTRSAYTDVHLGVIPRRQRGGGRADLVARASVLWADCDTPQSVATILSFFPPPSMMVRSGTAEHLHCYWLLSQPADVGDVERANRKLAHAIGADMQCTDSPRVLRPPWSRNWKHDPPVRVRIAQWRPTVRYVVTDVVAGLDDPPGPAARLRALPRGHVSVLADSVLEVEPAVYVERLTGIAVPAHGKIACPFTRTTRRASTCIASPNVAGTASGAAVVARSTTSRPVCGRCRLGEGTSSSFASVSPTPSSVPRVSAIPGSNRTAPECNARWRQ
jgi:hypothetical protein